MFLRLIYVDVNKNNIQSLRVVGILERNKLGLLAVLCTVPDMVCYPHTAQVLPRPDIQAKPYGGDCAM